MTATSLEKISAELVSLEGSLQTKASAASVAQVCTTRSGGGGEPGGTWLFPVTLHQLRLTQPLLHCRQQFLPVHVQHHTYQTCVMIKGRPTFTITSTLRCDGTACS